MEKTPETLTLLIYRPFGNSVTQYCWTQGDWYYTRTFIDLKSLRPKTVSVRLDQKSFKGLKSEINVSGYSVVIPSLPNPRRFERGVSGGKLFLDCQRELLGHIVKHRKFIQSQGPLEVREYTHYFKTPGKDFLEVSTYLTRAEFVAKNPVLKRFQKHPSKISKDTIRMSQFRPNVHRIVRKSPMPNSFGKKT